MASLLGEVIIIEKDTLMVVDYNSSFGTYTMSDGRKVDSHLVDKLVKK